MFAEDTVVVLKMKKICVIGGGRWGENHIRTLHEMGNLGAVVDMNASRLAELKEKYGSLYRDYAEESRQLESLRKKYDDLSKEIDKARIYYSTKASNVEKNGLRAELLSYEQEYYQMETEIHQLEKVIRSSELNAIK